MRTLLLTIVVPFVLVVITAARHWPSASHAYVARHG